MLGKLIKYEWRGYRIFTTVSAIILIATTLITSLSALTYTPYSSGTMEDISDFLTVISFLLYYFGIIACSLGISLSIAVRFYKTCYTDQGYLTHTLPVTARQLLHSKIIVAFINQILLIVGIFVSIMVVMCTYIMRIAKVEGEDIIIAELIEAFSDGFTVSFETEMGISMGGFMATMIILGIVGAICGVIIIYGCISLGQLYTKHRIIGAIIAYFAVTTIDQIAASIIGFASAYHFMSAFERGRDLLFGDFFFNMMLSVYIPTIIISVILYFVTHYMMTKKLNLE